MDRFELAREFKVTGDEGPGPQEIANVRALQQVCCELLCLTLNFCVA